MRKIGSGSGVAERGGFRANSLGSSWGGVKSPGVDAGKKCTQIIVVASRCRFHTFSSFALSSSLSSSMALVQYLLVATTPWPLRFAPTPAHPAMRAYTAVSSYSSLPQGLRRLRLEITHTCRCPLARPGYRKRGYRYRGSVSVFVAVLVFAQELGLMPRMPNRVVKRPRARSQVVHRCRQRRWKSGRPMSSIRYVNYS